MRSPGVAIGLALLLFVSTLPAPSTQAATSGTGAEVVQDDEGDHLDAFGPATDVLRVGARTEPTLLRFFVKVQDPQPPPTIVRYRLGFTVVGGLSYYATASYAPSGQVTGGTLWRAVPETARISGTAIVVDWLGSELRFTIARSLLGNPADGTELLQITAAVTSTPTAASEVRSTLTFYDDTEPGSYVVGFNTPFTVPSEPLNPAASGNLERITVTWNAPASNGGSDILSYQLYRGTASGNLAPRATLPASARNFHDADVLAGTQYFYRVAAVNGVGEGPPSNEVSARLATPVQPNPPTPPRNVTASGGNGAIYLEWQAPASNGGAAVQQYSVYRAGALVANTTNTFFYHDGLPNQQTFCYNVTASNVAGESAPSQGACATTTSSPPPGFPVPSAATGIGPGSKIFINGGMCTANFVWTDGVKRYLGSAGHCFLPSDRTATHGPGADFNASGVVVRVCVSSCLFGGATGGFVAGNLVTLGKVAYARQSENGAAVGNDFGIVEIPPLLWTLVRPSLPVWGGPVAGPDGRSTLGQTLCHYGVGWVMGETFATMARAGVGIGQSDAAGSFTYAGATISGDSGSAVVTCQVNTQTGVRGLAPVGIHTHSDLGAVVISLPGIKHGTTIAKAKSMAQQAGISLSLVYSG